MPRTDAGDQSNQSTRRQRKDTSVTPQTGTSDLQRRWKKPARQHKVKAKVQGTETSTQPQWVEDTPSFLDGILAFQATLTEEEKEALHLSLQVP